MTDEEKFDKKYPLTREEFQEVRKRLAGHLPSLSRLTDEEFKKTSIYKTSVAGNEAARIGAANAAKQTPEEARLEIYRNSKSSLHRRRLAQAMTAEQRREMTREELPYCRDCR
jgi:hypothetical protein